MLQKIPKKQRRSRPFEQLRRQEHQKRTNAFHQQLEMEGMAELRFENEPIGVLTLGNKGRRRNLEFVLGFRTHGLHYFQTEASAEQVLKKMQAALQSLPGSLRIECCKRAEDRQRQQQLDKKLERTPNDLLKLEIFSEKQRIQDLTQKGYRQMMEITFYVTCSLDGNDPNQAGMASLIEKGLQALEQQFRPDAAEADAAELQQQLHQLYYQHYQDWRNWFAQVGLSVVPMDAQHLWQRAVEQVCPKATTATTDVPLPQLLTIDETGLHETQTSERHPSLHLTRHGVPEAHPDYVKRGEVYTGVVSMMDKPAGFASAEHQLSYLSKVLAQPAVRDTDLIVEFTKSNPNLHRAALQLSNRQLNTQMSRAQEQGADDVGAALNAVDTIEAQKEIIQGAVPISVGMVALVHRKNPQALSIACSQLISAFDGAWMMREMDVAYQGWLQTLLVTRQKLLRYALFDQRLPYLSTEATAFMPLLKPRPHDEDGLELMAEAGSTPFHLDFTGPHALLGRRTLFILAATRGGKSLLVAKILMLALQEGIPVSSIDYPTPSGAST